METTTLVNESNRPLYEAFVLDSLKYAAIGEEYRAKALEKASQVIANYPEPIRGPSQLTGFPGIGVGSLRRINEFLTTGQIGGVAPQSGLPALPKPTPLPAQTKLIDVLAPSARVYSQVIIAKAEYKYMRETCLHYVFTNVL
jgi:DNA polymerase/3'-5' exonuclease PolX